MSSRRWTVAGNQPYDEPTRDVLEHGAGEPGRILAWGRSRSARGAAAGLAAVVALGWLLVGPGQPGGAGSGAPAAEPAGRTSSALLLQGGRGGVGDEGEHECEGSTEDEVADGARLVERADGLAGARSRALVSALRRFAADPGPRAAVPWAPRVLVLAEGPVPVDRVVDAAEADRRATWTDPSYLLAGLAATPARRLRVDDEHHVTCRGQPRKQAAGFEGKPWVSVQPRVLDNGCRGWWAVDLYLDARHRVSAVLVRS